MSNNHYLVLEPQDLEEKKTQKAHYNFTIGAIPFDGKARYAHGKKQDFDFMLENCEPNTSEEKHQLCNPPTFQLVVRCHLRITRIGLVVDFLK